MLIDHRERRSGVSGALARRERVEIGWTSLVTGDYLVPGTLLVERKTASDLTQSLVDGRLFRQAKRLVAQPLPALFLLEGDEADGCERSGVSPEALAGALVSLVLVYGLPVLRARDADESARLICYAADQLRRCSSPRPKRAGRPPSARRARQIRILEGFPGIGSRRAAALLDAFGSVAGVIGAGEEQLAEVRGVGPGLARRLREIAG